MQRNTWLAASVFLLALQTQASASQQECGEFDKNLFGDIVPYVESHYSVKTDRENRALAGLSMGGGQSLNFGLNHLDKFAWVGGFSSAPNAKQPASLIKDHAEAAQKLRLLWVSCGDQDGLIKISLNVHNMLEEKKVPHIYSVVPGGKHDFKQWKNDLYHFCQLIFQDLNAPAKQASNQAVNQAEEGRPGSTYVGDGSEVTLPVPVFPGAPPLSFARVSSPGEF